MQSSTAIAIRALIMLIVLISLPLFAIFGKSLPEVVKGLLEGRSLVLSPAPEGAAGSPNASPLPANNPFNQPTAYRATAEAGPGYSTPGASSPSLLNVGPGPNMIASSSAPPGNMVPMSYPGAMIAKAPEMSAGEKAGMPPGSPTASSMGGLPSGTIPSTSAALAAMQLAATPGASGGSDWHLPAATSAAQPASFQSPPEASALALANTTPQNSPSAAVPLDSAYAAKSASGGAAIAASNNSGLSDEKFRKAETRLRELGATHYMLETWGPDNNRYHFVCKMAIGGNAEVNRVFQAFGDDPWQAMETVLRQVEDWRARPQPQ